MPFDNFDSRHFSEAETTEINTAIETLENLLRAKLANLTPEERQKMGSINERNKLIVNKVKDYHDTQPALSSPDVDWAEFDNDFATRAYLSGLINRFSALGLGLGNAKILHDYDNYQAALTDYDYTKYKNGTSAAGYEEKENELKQFFTGGASASANVGGTDDGTV